MPELFAKSNVFGTFKGFNDRGFEFAAEIVAPYDSSMLERPQLGQFLLIELGSREEASLGRITKFVPSGLLASAEGEDYINTMQSRDQNVPEDLKKQKLKYKVQIKLLGAVKNISESGKQKIVFVPSQRRLPHLGAKVALPSNEVLQEICSLSDGGTDLGDYVLGEFIYSGKTSEPENMFRHLAPQLNVKFNISNLVSKRSVVFARAGYGKSNLIKYLIAELYRNGIPKSKGQNVGTLIFDADGEYFWPDSSGRPGLCDVPQLQDKIVVFSNRRGRNPYYDSWKVGEVKLDIRDLPARDVIGIAISPERQTQQNVLKLKSVSEANWRQLVDLIYVQGLQASDNDVGRLLGYTQAQAQTSGAEIAAARSNMYNVVNHLHDPNSSLILGTLQSLRNGYVVVIDISLLSSTAGYNIAGLLMRRIFAFNQENFTGTTSPIPVISIIEEAQSVLGRNLEESSPFVEWVKEGRKYDLGAILVTQQPGSMSPELLSQADNWFCFHLLSEGDAGTLGKYNSHYSNDVLAHLIGEPIQGNCYMWSAPKQPFVLPVRIRDFEALYKDNKKDSSTEPTFQQSPALEIKKKSEEALNSLRDALKQKFKENKAKLSLKTFQENSVKGIYGGQLYIFINQILTESAEKTEFRNENQLKSILLAKLLGVDVEKVNIINDGGRDYYCCDIEHWNNLAI
ncbi:MAG: ATP-binding protein [Bacteroidetes bacterium]|nr:ATP-binding protein [Bacteroidota bacterium]